MNQMTPLPKFWNYLSQQDKYQYLYLQTSFNQSSTKNKRNMRIDNFQRSLQTLRQYCLRGDGQDWRRCLVCGICWIPDGIAINIRQLTIIIGRCKSSINGSLQKMGYDVIDSRCEVLNAIESIIPVLKGNNQETRQWNIRKIGSSKVEIKPPAQPVFQVPVTPVIEVPNPSKQVQTNPIETSEPHFSISKTPDSLSGSPTLFGNQDPFQFSPTQIDQHLERFIQEKYIWDPAGSQDEINDWLLSL